MKIVNVVGARPQFVKYFPVARAIGAFNRDHPAGIEDILVHTGQHYDYALSKIFFDELGIREPEYHLGIGSGSHAGQTGAIMQKTEEVLLETRPDIVMVYGDTNSTLGAALAASKLNIPVAHVEAGLRSFNRAMPEEVNRVVADHLSSFLFCPGIAPVQQLAREGFSRNLYQGKLVPRKSVTIPGGQAVTPDHPLVVNVGDVMYDVLKFAVPEAETKSRIIENFGLDGVPYCLLTLHRAENTDDPGRLEDLIRYINQVGEGKTVIFPMHPRTRKCYANARVTFNETVKIIEPVSYFDLIKLMKHSTVLFTDSGGMQKEAFWLAVPCVTLREETEWTETVASRWNILYRNYTGSHRPRESFIPPYGDGYAAERIIGVLDAASRCGLDKKPS